MNLLNQPGFEAQDEELLEGLKSRRPMIRMRLPENDHIPTIYTVAHRRPQ